MASPAQDPDTWVPCPRCGDHPMLACSLCGGHRTGYVVRPWVAVAWALYGWGLEHTLTPTHWANWRAAQKP